MITATSKKDAMSKLREYAKNGDISRLREFTEDHHTKLPDGLECVNSWLGVTGERFFQLVKTSDENLLKEWIIQLSDLFQIEVDCVAPIPPSGKSSC